MRSLICTLAFGFLLIRCSAQADCSLAIDLSCQPQGVGESTKVFERLNAVGEPGQYQLSGVPVNQLPLRIFKDGLELTAGVDFKLNGRLVLMYGRNAQSEGSLYQAAYFVAREQTRSATKQPVAKAALVIDAYLTDSLNAELGTGKPYSEVNGTETAIHARHTGQRGTTNDARVTPSSARSAESSEPVSFRMLATVQAERAGAERDLRRSRGGRRADGATGSEGLGDVYVPSPFSQDTPRGVQGKNTSRRTEQEPASERMLRSIALSAY